MVNRFERHLALSDAARSNPLYVLVPLTSPVLALAAALCNHYGQINPHPLRSLDAVQLACTLAVASNIGDNLTFVTADVRLAAIAALQGLRVVNPAHPPQTHPPQP